MSREEIIRYLDELIRFNEERQRVNVLMPIDSAVAIRDELKQSTP